MKERIQYRLSKNEKSEIAQNLIDILQKDANISELTRGFIYNWIRTGPEEKRKAFFDVWDIVLKNYLPTERPLLFRSSKRISKKDKISSYTGRFECARRFGNDKDYLIICDTKIELEFDEKFNKPGNYVRTFYPLVDVLVKARDNGGFGFFESIFDYIVEDEYIMRVNLGNINKLKWIKK